ncbi:site-specific integrase [Mycobacterium sp. 1165196.3]|uniref:tyrosine-type recombinase/integrase n=1 Tax=Mycobacterium sp. 1165196.3 TaxID=1834071 RepID=UPI000AC2A61C|nr:site-specific integrase [Mycobacterium sp. 1165196.3]
MPPDVGADAFGVVAEQWLLTKGHRKPKTLAGYRSLLDTVVLPKWADVPLKAITYADLSAWLSGLKLSASRVRQAHQVIGAVYRYAVKAGLASKNPATEIDRRHDLPEEREAERHYLTLTQLLDLAGETGRFEALTLVLGFCGLRFGEAIALRRRDVGDRELIVRRSVTYVQGQGMVETDTKTRRSRHVPVPDPVWHLLDLPHDGGDLLFPGKNGFLTLGEYRWQFDNAVKRLQEAAKAKRTEEAENGKPTTPEFPIISPHSLRHTCASLAISAGANVKVVQRLLGHATAAMTLDLYGHLMADDLTGVATALGNAITAARSRN